MRHFKVALTLTMLAGLTGCTYGPAALRMSRGQYNAAIQETNEEQLLLNLVRLRYRDYPFFLEPGSISAQFNLKLGGSVARENSIGFTEDFRIYGGSAGFEDRPTITFNPLRGEDLAKSFLEPVSVDTIALLYYSGWSIDRIFRLLVHHMNGLGNAMSAAGPTPSLAPNFRDFAEATSMLYDLQKREKLILNYEPTVSTLSVALAKEDLSPHDFVEARGAGLRYAEEEDGSGNLRLVEETSKLFMRIVPEALSSGSAAGLDELLGWGAPSDSDRQVRIQVVQGISDSRDESSRKDRLIVTTRSLMGAMFYLSQSVTPPPSHFKAGLVTETTEDGTPFNWSELTKDLFQVHHSRSRPKQSAVQIKYRGHWFYVRDSDKDTKSTLMLLAQLISLQSGNQISPAPLLTLPVGG